MAQNKNGQYWSKRFTKLEETLNCYGQNTYRQIEPAFNQAQREIQSKIDSWVVRVANNNQVSLTEAKRMLDAKELAEFRWNVKEYIKYGHDNELDAGWMKELENASARYHISRLEALKVQTQQAMEKAFGNELDELDSMSRKVYSEGHYNTAYEIQRGFNVGWDVSKIDESKLEKLISKPWAADGKNFSDRIWQSKTSMINELHNELVRTCLLGKSPDEAIKHMTKFVDKKFKNAKMQAGRLVMTEQAFFASAAQKDAFTDLDVEEFEVVATLDSHTSEICQAMDGQHFPMKDYQPGVTAPPLHVWCRSTTVPFFDDGFSLGERAARGEDGKTYYVPDSMKYDDWKKSFVDGSKEDLKYIKRKNIISKEDLSKEAKEILESCEVNKVEYREVQRLQKELTSDEIIERLAGGDMTEGSCSSLAFAYIANTNGLDVLDFRGGGSQDVFARVGNIKRMLKLQGVEGSITKVKKEIQGTLEVLKNLELNEEYYLATGKHAAVVRRSEGRYEYLELQSDVEKGWTSFLNKEYGSVANTLHKRFGCRKSIDKSYGILWEKEVVLMKVKSFKNNPEFEHLLGYINTAVEDQMKGELGYVR